MVNVNRSKLESCKLKMSIRSAHVSGHIIEGVQELPDSFQLADCKSMVVVTAEEGITTVLPGKGIKS